MAETFLFTQTVSAEDLNNVAIDLGATTFNEFSDGVEYAVTKLNDITKSIVGKGILNNGNQCQCSISDGKIIIENGIIVFENGAKIKIRDTLQLDLPESEKIYIYAVNNEVSNTASIEVKTEALTTGDYVLLAEYENGTLTDRRVIAKAKVQLPAEGNSFKMVVNVPEELESFEFSVPVAGASKLIFENQGDLNNSFNVDAFLEIFDIDTKLFFGFPATNMDSRFVTNGRDFILDGDSWHDTLTFVKILNDNAVFRVTPYPVYTNDKKKKTNSHQFNIYIYGGIEK